MRPSLVLAVACVVLLSGACGGPEAAAPTIAAPAAPVSASPSATASPAPAAAPAGALVFSVGPGSKATVKVREQLADLVAPSDAVLSTGAVSGAFTLLPDGTFAADSKISVDLRTLRSDRSQRDQFIQRNPLETARFPNAELVPKRATGLVLPLAASGDLTLSVVGSLTIHGVTKDVTLDVRAKRSGRDLTATASNASAPWTFADFGMSRPSVFVVVSIVDRIDVVVDLVATEVR